MHTHRTVAGLKEGASAILSPLSSRPQGGKLTPMDSIIIQMSEVRQKTSGYLRNVEDRVYGWFYELFLWQESQLSKLDESPTIVKLLVDSRTFGIVIFACIAVHALLSAIDVNLRAKGEDQSGYLEPMAVFFLLIYGVEAFLRLVAYGRLFFLDPYCLFDGALIAIELVDMFLGSGSTHVLLFRILRSMRLLRLLKSLRMFRQLRLLWNSFVAGLVSLLWATVLLFIFTFIWAVFLTDVLNGALKEGEATGEGVSLFVGSNQVEFISIYFGDVPKTMVTLFQVCTGAESLMRPAQAIVPGLQWVLGAQPMTGGG